MKSGAALLAVLIGMLSTPPEMSRADDGAIEAVGGTIRLMDDHPSIRMTAEFVHAWVSKDRVLVECVFFLENDGPAATVMVGFPNSSGGADVASFVPFREFRSFVDGVEVQVLVQPDSTPAIGEYVSWMVKEVGFGENQVRCLRNVYVAEPGMSWPNNGAFEYILQTGSSWAGPIGAGDIVLTLEDIHPDSVFYVAPPATSRTANELRWHFERLEPSSRSDFHSIHVAWKN